MTEHRTSILVVDDDDDIRFDLRQVLEDEGYHVMTARHGKEALERLREGDRPCLILLDLMMPVMDGTEFLEHQRGDPAIANVPVVVVTAFVDRAGGLHTAGLIPKPVEIDPLLSTVRTHCGQSPDRRT
jgi:CheY-like chemotaxis protein